MKYFIRTTEQAETTPEINMSPLIDMVFLLLIFFMVTTVFVQETGIDINRPQAESATKQQPLSIMVQLNAQGQVIFRQETLTPQQLQDKLQQDSNGQPLSVVIIADQQAPTGLLVTLIDICKLAGADKVAVAAQPPLP